MARQDERGAVEDEGVKDKITRRCPEMVQTSKYVRIG